MKRKIYKLLTPKSIQESIYRANAQQFNALEVERVCAIEESLPPAELSAVYIANLQVLTDRHAFLNAMPKNAIVGEMGVQNGEFSNKILVITIPKRLHLIGAWPTEEYTNGSVERQIRMIETKFCAEISAGQVTIHRAAPLAELENFNEGYFDWLYIDAGRSFDSLLQTLNICERKVKMNGIIAGRNYSTGSVLHRVRYGVIEAVHEFCKKNGWEMIYLTNERHRNLSYAIRKMAD